MDKLTPHQELCSDTLDNAIEGGINYWAVGRKFQRTPQDQERAGSYLACELKPNPDDGAAFSDDDPRNDWQVIDLAKIEAAMVLLMSPAGVKLCRKDIIEDIRADWSDPDACRSDAETADVIIQVALFGDVVFG